MCNARNVGPDQGWGITRTISSAPWNSQFGCNGSCQSHDDIIKWKHFPRYWSFWRGIHRSVDSPHKGQRRGAWMFSLICAWRNGWANNRDAGDLRRHHAHCDVSVMLSELHSWLCHRSSLCHIFHGIGNSCASDNSDVITSAMTSQITGVSIVCSTVCSGADQRKCQSSASLAFGIHRWLVDSPHKGPVTLKCSHLMTSSWAVKHLS